MNDFTFTIKNLQPGKMLCNSNDIKYSFSKQFKRDSFLRERSNSFLLFIGICYNKEEFDCGYNLEWGETLLSCFENDVSKTLKKINGYFSGVYFDSVNNDLYLFSDHLASIPIYYYRSSRFLVVDTDLIRLSASIRRLGGNCLFSEFGAYSMLAYSFMIDDHTPLENVYKVKASSVYSYKRGCVRKYYEYYSFDKKLKESKISIAEGIDYYFLKAVRECLSIDENSHLFTLSGGLDSRMYLLYAINCGAENITTINYSQTFYREEVIARRIASNLCCKHIFFSLDNGYYLSEIAEGIRATQGMTTYRPILSARLVWKSLNLESYNAIHTGLLGDAIIGGYCIDKCNEDDCFHSPIDFATQLNAKNKLILGEDYGNEFIPFFKEINGWISEQQLNEIPAERYVLDNRYINGLVQSALGTRNISVFMSPYVSKELMKYIFSYPSKMRLNHDIYFEWMKLFAPMATRYQWENTGLRPMYLGLSVKPKSIISRAYKRIQNISKINKPENSRNPYNYWIKDNNWIILKALIKLQYNKKYEL